MSSMAKCFLTISVLIFNGAEKRTRGSKFKVSYFRFECQLSVRQNSKGANNLTQVEIFIFSTSGSFHEHGVSVTFGPSEINCALFIASYCIQNTIA